MQNWFEIIRFIIITPMAASFLAERSGIMESFKYWLFRRVYTKKTRYRPYRLKPFDCAMCLSFWLCLAQVAPSLDWQDYFYPFAAAAVGSILSKF